MKKLITIIITVMLSGAALYAQEGDDTADSGKAIGLSFAIDYYSNYLCLFTSLSSDCYLKIIDIKQQAHFGERHYFKIQLDFLFNGYRNHTKIILVYNWLVFVSFIEFFNKYIGIKTF